LLFLNIELSISDLYQEGRLFDRHNCIAWCDGHSTTNLFQSFNL
jgi:hypothetical protein